MGVAELSAGRVAGARDAEAMSRLGNYGDFSITFNLESLVLPDSQVTFIHRLPGLSSVLLVSKSSMVFRRRRGET